MTYETRLQRIVIACGVVLAVGLIFVPYWGGALAMLVLIATAVGLLVLNRHVARAFGSSLRQVGAELGLYTAERAADPRYRELATAAARTFDTTTRMWKVDGYFPCLIGRLGGLLVTVRVPYGFQYDRKARETTRIAVHHRNNYEGFVIVARNGLDAEPPHAVATDIASFDTRFVVSGRRAEEPRECLTAEACAAIERLPDTGVGGIRVTPYGIFYHTPGKLVDGDRIKLILAALGAVAASIPERDPLHRRA